MTHSADSIEKLHSVSSHQVADNSRSAEDEVELKVYATRIYR